MQAYAALARQPQNSPIAICSLWSAIRLKSVAGRCKCGKSHCSNSKTAMFTLVPHFSTSSEIYKWCSFFLTNMGKASDIETLKCVVVLQIQARFYTGGMYNPINVFRQFSLKLKCRRYLFECLALRQVQLERHQQMQWERERKSQALRDVGCIVGDITTSHRHRNVETTCFNIRATGKFKFQQTNEMFASLPRFRSMFWIISWTLLLISYVSASQQVMTVNVEHWMQDIVWYFCHKPNTFNLNWVHRKKFMMRITSELLKFSTIPINILPLVKV